MLVILAQIGVERMVFGPFRNISIVRNRIMVNDKIRSVGGVTQFGGNFRYILGSTMFAEISIETINPEEHTNIIEL